MSLGEDIMSIREDIELYTKLSGEDGSQETIATIGAYLRGYRQGKEDAEPHWIPVTERLPDEETDVLVTVHFLGLKRTHRNGWNEHIKESFYVEVASHINGEWSSASDEYKIAKDRHKVIAWMPLPEPYKGVTE